MSGSLYMTFIFLKKILPCLYHNRMLFFGKTPKNGSILRHKELLIRHGVAWVWCVGSLFDYENEFLKLVLKLILFGMFLEALWV